MPPHGGVAPAGDHPAVEIKDAGQLVAGKPDLIGLARGKGDNGAT